MTIHFIFTSGSLLACNSCVIIQWRNIFLSRIIQSLTKLTSQAVAPLLAHITCSGKIVSRILSEFSGFHFTGYITAHTTKISVLMIVALFVFIDNVFDGCNTGNLCTQILFNWTENSASYTWALYLKLGELDVEPTRLSRVTLVRV